MIKAEPEEQEDLIMSYLNTDYLSEQPLSPPDSIATSSYYSDITNSPEKQMMDEFNFDSTVWMNNPHEMLNNENNLFIDNDILNNFQFYLNNTPITAEQPKKKRGRKKREPSVQLNTMAQSSLLLAPKPLAPKPILNAPTPAPIIQNNNQVPVIKEEPDNDGEEQKKLQIQKRQERLIKNRAAALLSRKRKREHLTNLEDENKKLVEENKSLNQRIQMLEKENLDLKAKLKETTVINMPSSLPQKKTSVKKSASSVVFMILLFSFALFTLPSKNQLNYQLTVGGASYHYPLIDSPTPVKDLVLLDSVRPRDLQTWINHRLDKSQQNSKPNTSHVYLYSKEFSQLASSSLVNQDTTNMNLPPLISIFSPFNQSVKEDQCDSYLQIDVQVLRSNVIKGHLFSLDKNSVGLLDGELVLSNNVTRKSNNQSIVKREKRTKKLARVIM